MLTIDNRLQRLGARQLSQQDSKTERSLARLASGTRINSARDDSAGLQIANRLTINHNAQQQLMRNLQDGISYSQTAEGALSQIQQITQRMRQLAIQAANGVNSDEDRQALDQAYGQLKQQIDGIAYGTELFGSYPLLGSETTDANLKNLVTLDSVLQKNVQAKMTSGIRSIAYIPAGSKGISITLYDLGADDDLQLFTPSGQQIVGTDIYSDPVWSSQGITDAATLKSQFLLPANGYDDDAQYDASTLLGAGSHSLLGMTIDYSGDQHDSGDLTETLTLDYTTEDLILSVVGTGSFDITADWQELGTGSQSSATDPRFGPGLQITATSVVNTTDNFIELGKCPARTEDLGLDGTALDPVEQAMAAISALDGAIKSLGEKQAYHGAKINAMEGIMRNTQIAQENSDAARMRIRDADFASETASLSYNNILSQSTTAVLSQANTSSQLAMQLLNDSQQE